jgi:hypothetical protein
MKTAVDKVHKGKGRTVNSRFAVMCAHYLFDADFCNVASGWEKGVVEKNVQDSRLRIWIEARGQRFGSFAELNAWLASRCRSLWEQVKHPDYRDLSIADVFEQERAHLMPMPTPFDGYVERAARVSSTCLVVVGRNRYSVPCEFAGQMLSTRLYPGRVVVVGDDAVVAEHERLGDEGLVRYDWQHYIPLIQRKPGALRNGAPFLDMPEPLQRLRRALLRRVRDGEGSGAGTGKRPGRRADCGRAGARTGAAVRARQRRACGERAVAHAQCANATEDRYGAATGDAAAGRHLALRRAAPGAATTGGRSCVI